MEQKGITGAVLSSLKFADESVRHNYLENIIVTGGNTRFAGFSARLYEEIKRNSFCWVKPRIYVVKYRSVYIVTFTRGTRLLLWRAIRTISLIKLYSKIGIVNKDLTEFR